MITITYRTPRGDTRKIQFPATAPTLARRFALDIRRTLRLPKTAIQIRGPQGRFTRQFA